MSSAFPVKVIPSAVVVNPPYPVDQVRYPRVERPDDRGRGAPLPWSSHRVLHRATSVHPSLHHGESVAFGTLLLSTNRVFCNAHTWDMVFVHLLGVSGAGWFVPYATPRVLSAVLRDSCWCRAMHAC